MNGGELVYEEILRYFTSSETHSVTELNSKFHFMPSILPFDIILLVVLSCSSIHC